MSFLKKTAYASFITLASSYLIGCSIGRYPGLMPLTDEKSGVESRIMLADARYELERKVEDENCPYCKITGLPNIIHKFAEGYRKEIMGADIIIKIPAEIKIVYPPKKKD